MSDTPKPRTDGKTVLTPVLGLEGDMYELVTADFARQLERELAYAKKRFRKQCDGQALADLAEMRRKYEEGQK